MFQPKLFNKQEIQTKDCNLNNSRIIWTEFLDQASIKVFLSQKLVFQRSPLRKSSILTTGYLCLYYLEVCYCHSLAIGVQTVEFYFIPILKYMQTRVCYKIPRLKIQRLYDDIISDVDFSFTNGKPALQWKKCVDHKEDLKINLIWSNSIDFSTKYTPKIIWQF